MIDELLAEPSKDEVQCMIDDQKRETFCNRIISRRIIEYLADKFAEVENDEKYVGVVTMPFRVLQALENTNDCIELEDAGTQILIRHLLAYFPGLEDSDRVSDKMIFGAVIVVREDEIKCFGIDTSIKSLR